MTFAPIAIVGRGCVLPGASTPEALGELSRRGRVALGSAPAGRWRISDERVLRRADEIGPDCTWSNRGGYVTDDPHAGLEHLDEAKLGGPVSRLDPVFTWLLRAGGEALRDARLEGGGARVGAVVGNLSFPTAGMARFAEAAWLTDAGATAWQLGLAELEPLDPRNRFMSGLPAHLLARAYDLGAGAFALDAACASSLVALEIACARLQRGEADAMLTGAVNAADDLFLHMGFRALEALSKSGRSRPFHAEADGLLPAEGAALVALKRLDDAQRDGDRIHAVIRGVGLSNDGRGRGLLVPSREGQERALREAYRRAGLDPQRLGWLECHATGTQVGDGVELASMAAALGDRTDALPIGSLKANLGHLITAAGAAGLLRVLEAMRTETLPPTPQVERALPALDELPFEVLNEARAWPAGDEPRLAGVSAFGFGGNNAHVVLEEWREQRVQVAVPAAPRPAIAIVALGAHMGEHGGASFAEGCLREGAPGLDRASNWTSSITLPLAGLRFPPKALEETLPQQLLLLDVAARATEQLREPLDGERTSVFVGMGCDTAVARHGARWRLAEWARRWGGDEGWLEEARDAAAPLLGSAGVLGCMPNICANRLNSQLDLRGPSATIASEELSGLRALAVARRFLEEGRIDAALVAAADLSAEPAHVLATDGLGEAVPPADAAMALVLMRLDDAEARGETVLAVLDDRADGRRIDPKAIARRLGKAHAASGLVALAVALDEAGPVRLDVEALGGERETLGMDVRPFSRREASPPRGPSKTFAAHAPALSLPAVTPKPLPDAPSLQAPTLRDAAPAARPQLSVPLPVPIPEPRGDLPPAPPPPRPATPEEAPPQSPLLTALVQHGDRQLARHQAFLATQAAAFEQYRQLQRGLLQQFLPTAPAAPVPAPVPAPAPAPRSLPRFDKRQLAIHASGQISDIFGPLFTQQDGYALQVRMPERRLLLADRVTAIDAEPGVLGEGTVWTETDVEEDSWFLHLGRMPAGLMIEAGQADLFLISYMGIDFLNRGARAYRLLGCDVTYRRTLPAPGETLRYDIHVDGHAEQGDVRLFFFHYDCRIGDEVVLSVRNGQAGFFSEEELAGSDGVIWSPETQAIDPEARLDPPRVEVDQQDFGPEAIAAFARGDLHGCFGAGFELGRAHVRSPCIQGGEMSFIDRVEGFDARGGPWGRGYLKAIKAIRPDLWFFDGHFKNDPCMPGTLMLEGCLQMMAFYLAALGHTLDRDGWRFEPVLDHSVNLRCRGQVLPQDEELICEIFVEEVHDGPYPTIYADLLGTVNGLKAFHARRMGLRLVPDWPLASQGRELLRAAGDDDVAVVDGFRFDFASLLACAWGKPSEAFGPMYRPFDDLRRVPRLPGPPYHFMSRVLEVEGPIGGMQVGTRACIEYDVPPDAWYFRDNGAAVMPFAVLLEVVLQPCGWLASYVGSALTVDHDLSFRNLDGDGVVHLDVGPDVGSLRTTTELTSISQTGGMIIQSFSLRCHAGERLVYELDTVFGFFPHEALQNQVGLPTSDAQRAAMEATAPATPLPASEAGPQLAKPGLLMLDRIVAYDPKGGDEGLGWIAGDKDVDPGEWFFKAHFFQDPVQPGSLGLEALLQLLQAFMLYEGMADDGARFEAIRTDARTRWKYRGQVVPHNRVIRTTMSITERGARHVVGRGSLWIDGKRIYEAVDLGMRIVDGA